MRLQAGHWLYEHIARGNCNGCQGCDRVPDAEKATIRAAGPTLVPVPGEGPIINGRRRPPLMNRRWGPCSHCGAEGWEVEGGTIRARFDHDRPDGKKCRKAEEDRKKGEQHAHTEAT